MIVSLHYVLADEADAPASVRAHAGSRWIEPPIRLAPAELGLSQPPGVAAVVVGVEVVGDCLQICYYLDY